MKIAEAKSAAYARHSVNVKAQIYEKEQLKKQQRMDMLDEGRKLRM